MDNLNNNSNNDNNSNNNNNLNSENTNENTNVRTFYFNSGDTNENIIQQITNFINNISNINQINQDNNINIIDGVSAELNNLNPILNQLSTSEINSSNSDETHNSNQNVQMFFEIEFVMDPQNLDEEEISHFNNCNHINEVLGKAIYIKKDDLILQSECSICMDNYKYKQYKRILPDCKHTFHKKCIDNWFKKKSSCPVCRKDFLDNQNNIS